MAKNQTQNQPSPSSNAGRYQNRFTQDQHGLFDALKWLWGSRSRLFGFVPPVFEKKMPDVAFLKQNREAATATWIGHATYLLQWGGLNVITDPHLTRYASPLPSKLLQRHAPLGLDFQELPALDIALVSHDHYDHLDASTVKRLRKDQPNIHWVCAKGLKHWFGEKCTELDWWESINIGETLITAVPVQHFSGRGLRRNQTLWCGFVVEHAHKGVKKQVFFAGDTGYSADFAEIYQKHGAMDLCLLPIGAYEPRWFMKDMHVNPEDAVKIHQDLHSQQSLAMHWGTFRLTEEPMDEPPQQLTVALQAAGLDSAAFQVLQHGETVFWNR
jgi:N-acyl-phosphatidylethanolamine-hydrolysing phospholipase D